MQTIRQRPSQVEFTCSSVPNLQPGFPPQTFRRNAFSGREDALRSDKDTPWKEQILYAISEAHALLAAEVRTANPEDVFPITSDMYEPERILPNTAPPKRFFRTFWRSITLRMLDREFNASLMSE